MKKIKVYAIVGPTGSGKTALSIELAKNINAEIINADSKQVYKGIPITTGCISKKEEQGIIHHLFNFCPLDKIYSVVEFRKDIEKKIYEINKKKKNIIIAGGTSLLIYSLLENYQFPMSSYDPDYVKVINKKTSDELWNDLNKVDSVYAQKIHKNNRRRVLRALEVFHSTTTKMSDLKKKPSLFDIEIYMPKIKNRDILYDKINQRAEYIWNNGLLEEARALLDMNLDPSLPALTSIGIKEAFDYLKNKITKDQALDSMRQRSRRYAKRQMTWWRSNGNLKEAGSYKDILKNIKH